MGVFDKLTEKSRGIVTSAKHEDGAPQLSAEEVRSRLPAISGKGIETGVDGEEVVVSCSAKIASAGPGGGEYEYTQTDAELGADGLSATKGWEKGQHVGSETVHVTPGSARTPPRAGADESGYKFSWSDLRDPAIDAVTGWTYKPRKI